jgi:hypothetical protein
MRTFELLNRGQLSACLCQNLKRLISHDQVAYIVVSLLFKENDTVCTYLKGKQRDWTRLNQLLTKLASSTPPYRTIIFIPTNFTFDH